MITWKPTTPSRWAGYDETMKQLFGGPIRVAVIEVRSPWNKPKYNACVTIRLNHVWEYFETEAEAKAYCEALYALETSS